MLCLGGAGLCLGGAGLSDVGLMVLCCVSVGWCWWRQNLHPPPQPRLRVPLLKENKRLDLCSELHSMVSFDHKDI